MKILTVKDLVKASQNISYCISLKLSFEIEPKMLSVRPGQWIIETAQKMYV